MSTIKVNKIENTSTADGGVAIDVDGHVTIDGQNFPTTGPLSNRNLIINGAMQVAQRGSSFTSLGNGSSDYLVDRFQYQEGGSTSSVFTATKDTDAPIGFSNSLKFDCTTADASPGATDVVWLAHKIEAQNLQQLAYGTASASALSLSFYIKTNVTGVYAIRVDQPDGTRVMQLNYTIDAEDSGTWVKKIFTIAGDTAGTIADDNGLGLDFQFYLLAGTDRNQSTPLNVWADNTSSTTRAAGHNVNVAGSTTNYWQITGVQLEVGSKSTPFEHRSYGDELQRCQRYYQSHTLGSNNLSLEGNAPAVNSYVIGAYLLPVAMNHTPDITSVLGTLNSNLTSQGIAANSNSQVQYNIRSAAAGRFYGGFNSFTAEAEL